MERYTFFSNIMTTNKKCINAFRAIGCKHYFPSCDRTGRTTQEQKLCKATCDYFVKICKKAVDFGENLNQRDLNCTTFPTREAGASPECWYYDGKISHGKVTHFYKLTSNEKYL